MDNACPAVSNGDRRGRNRLSVTALEAEAALAAVARGRRLPREAGRIIEAWGLLCQRFVGFGGKLVCLATRLGRRDQLPEARATRPGCPRFAKLPLRVNSRRSERAWRVLLEALVDDVLGDEGVGDPGPLLHYAGYLTGVAVFVVVPDVQDDPVFTGDGGAAVDDAGVAVANEVR